MTSLNQMPAEVAGKLSDMVWAAAWHAANNRKGYKADATGDKIRFDNSYEELKEKAEGLEISTFTIDNIRWGAWNIAWHCAERAIAKKKKAAESAWNRHQEHFNNIRHGNELSENLVANIQNFSFHAAWHCTQSRVGNTDEAKSDRFKADDYYSKISGETLLTKIDFTVDEAKILSSKPRALIKQILRNQSDREQEVEVSYTKSESRMTSWGKTLGFTVGIEYETEAGFLVFKAGTEFSFSTSFTKSWGESSETSEQRTYTFPVKVGAKQLLVAEARVTEAEMDVPYVATYTVGDVERHFEGIWKGVCVSSAETHIGSPVSIDTEISKLGINQGSDEPALEVKDIGDF